MAQFEILLSQAKATVGDFDAAVSDYIKALEAHRHTEGEPAPAAAHPFVERAVSRVQKPGAADSFVANYRIIDDTPSLDDRKIDLANRVTAQANAAIDAIDPPLKRALRNHHFADAAAVEVPDDRAKEVIAEYQARAAKVQAVYRQLAQAHSDIHDLTADALAGYVSPFTS